MLFPYSVHGGILWNWAIPSHESEYARAHSWIVLTSSDFLCFHQAVLLKQLLCFYEMYQSISPLHTFFRSQAPASTPSNTDRSYITLDWRMVQAHGLAAEMVKANVDILPVQGTICRNWCMETLTHVIRLQIYHTHVVCKHCCDMVFLWHWQFC